MEKPSCYKAELPEGIPKYTKEEILPLLTQAENLQHLRIYYFLVAETIFFLAAGTALTAPFPLIVLSVAGVLVAVLFTLTNVKLYWRILWMVRYLQCIDPLYRDYMTFDSFHRLVTLGDWESDLKSFLTLQKCGDRKPRYLDTGWLYTYGLFYIVSAAWLCFIGYAIYLCCFTSK
jgi:hypothetical protein